MVDYRNDQIRSTSPVCLKDSDCSFPPALSQRVLDYLSLGLGVTLYTCMATTSSEHKHQINQLGENAQDANDSQCFDHGTSLRKCIFAECKRRSRAVRSGTNDMILVPSCDRILYTHVPGCDQRSRADR